MSQKLLKLQIYQMSQKFYLLFGCSLNLKTDFNERFKISRDIR